MKKLVVVDKEGNELHKALFDTKVGIMYATCTKLNNLIDETDSTIDEIRITVSGKETKKCDDPIMMPSKLVDYVLA